MLKISIIVPVYNVEKYLPRCLESLLNQTLPDIEIICINDGSTDDSLSILEAYAQKDQRLKILSQTNAGQGTARSVGLEHAQGEYIGFVDSDDFCNLEMYEKLYQKAIESKADIVCGGTNPVYEAFTERQDIEADYFLIKQEGLVTNYPNLLLEMGNEIWNKIYKKSFLDAFKIDFPRGCMFEDIFFSFSCILQARKIYFLPEPLYNYVRREGSFVGDILNKKSSYYNDLIIIYQKLYEMLSVKKLWNSYSKIFWQFILKNFFFVFDNSTPQNQTLFLKNMKTFLQPFCFSDLLQNTTSDDYHILRKMKKGTFLKKPSKHAIKFLGIVLFKKKKKATKTKYYILGIKVWSKKNSIDQIINQTLDLMLQDIKLDFSNLKLELFDCTQKLDEKLVKPNQFLYTDNNEKWYLQNFYTTFNIDKQKILALLSGLDTNSAETVIKAINRVQLIRNNNYADIDIFDAEEKRIQQELVQKFYANILKIDDDLFAYKNYFMPLKTFEPGVFYHNHSLDCLQNPEKIKNKSIIDVGAYIGDSALVFQSLKARRIYSFEANSANAKAMTQTLKLNHLTNVEIINKALGAEKAEISISIDGSGSRCDVSGERQSALVEMITLDDFVNENKINDIAFIKVDIEGFEPHFLQGAINTIRAQKPTLMICIYHNWDDFMNIKPMIESWNLGYKFKIVKPVDNAVILETILICEQE